MARARGQDSSEAPPVPAGVPRRPVSGGRASAQSMEPIEQTPGGDPWSEVPPEVQEMLRAEMARRQAASGQPGGRAETTGRRAPRPPAQGSGAPADTAPAETAPVTATAPAEEAKPKRAPRKRSSALEGRRQRVGRDCRPGGHRLA